MNLELIKKYEKEFLHMLHGGTLMFKPNDKQVWFDSVTSPIDWTVEGLYVIDDIYCTYRMALAEGKTIECCLSKNYYPDIWNYFDPRCKFNEPIDCYRIKPEEPELQIGDWVIVNGPAGTFIECISSINTDTYTLSRTNVCYKSQAIKWEPKEGEICIFWDSVYTSAVISKFSHMKQEKYSTDLYAWNNCMPFTGILPPHMKDSK